MVVSVHTETVLTPALSRFLETADAHTYSMMLEFPQHHRRCHATLASTTLGCIDILRYSGSGLQKSQRRREHILADNRDDYFLCLPQRAEFGIRCAGHESKSQPNSFVFFPTYRPFQAYICETPSHTDFTSVFTRIPGSLLRHRVPRIDDLCGQFFPLSRGIAQAMKWNLYAAQEEGPYLEERQMEILGTSTMDIICEVAKQALGEAGEDARHLSASDKTLRRAKSYIEANLSDQSLSPQTVADHCHISTRYLSMVFSAAGMPVGAYIKELRLQRCCEALRNADLSYLSIMEIATQWGFSSSSYFSQAYKSRFGKPPRLERSDAGNKKSERKIVLR